MQKMVRKQKMENTSVPMNVIRRPLTKNLHFQKADTDS